MLSDRLRELNILPKSLDSSNDISDVTKNRITTEENRQSVNNALLGGLFTNRQNSLTDIFRGDFPSVGKSCPLVLDKDLWQYVIVLHNPDYNQKKNHSVTKAFAENFYKNVFRKKTESNPHTANIHYEQEKRAFFEVFNELDDFQDGKSFKNGGKVMAQDDNFLDFGSVTKDFTTLARNALMYKLVGNLGLKVKQLMSISGKYIIFLVSADSADLKLEAEKTRYAKHLEISQVDLLSLMPCDEALRPFHVLRLPNIPITKVFNKLKRFYREIFKYDKQSETFSFDYEPVGVSEAQWQAYTEFCTLMKIGIKEVKKSSISESRKVVMFRKLVKDSMEKVNKGLSSRHRLKNLWDHLSIKKEIAPFFEYKNFIDHSHMEKVWRYYTVNENGSRDLFKNMEKIRLTSGIIDRIVDLGLLEKYKIVVGHFPLHNQWELNGKQKKLGFDLGHEDTLMHNFLINLKSTDEKRPLSQQWRVSLLYNNLPLSKLRNYYGEKIAMYFEFLRMLHTFLFYPSIFGIIVFSLQHSYEIDNNYLVKGFNIAYSILMTAWATVFNECWKQKEASLAILWGQTKFEQVDVPRGRYTGQARRSPVTDEMDEIHFPSYMRMKFFLLSATATLFIIFLVLSFVASFIILKTTYKSVYVYYLASLGNAIQIQFFNFIYSKLAVKLTEYENHKTREQYEDSLITKTFCFQFVNSFNSFFYIAFIKPYTVGCKISGDGQKDTCMHELFIQLLLIFLVSYFKNLIEIGLPLLKYQFRKRSNSDGIHILEDTSKDSDIRVEIESEINKDCYLTRDVDGTISDYLELAIQFGMLTLFAIAFPLSTVLAFIGLWLEMYTDKFKIMNLVRRPVPLPAKDIGSWNVIFNAISVFSIFTNAALFCFTASTFNDAADSIKFIVYGIVVIILLIFRAQLQIWIPDILPKYEIIAARHDYLISKLLQVDKVEKIEEEIEAYDKTLYFTKSRFN